MKDEKITEDTLRKALSGYMNIKGQEILDKEHYDVNDGFAYPDEEQVKGFRKICNREFKKIWLRNTNSWIVMDKKGTVKLVGQDYNLMEKDNQYMVFGNNCKINKWSKKKILDLAENMNYNYFNLSNDYNKTVKSKKYNMGQEFYSDSSKILSYYNKLKKNIVGLYEK